MTYREFRAQVLAAGWTQADFRYDKAPPPALEELTTTLGLDRYERFALRLKRELERKAMGEQTR